MKTKWSILLWIIPLIISYVAVGWFFARYYIRTPVIFQNPIVKRQLKIVVEQIKPSVEEIKEEFKTTNVIRGEASTYSSKGCLGCDKNLIMANGEKLDDDKFTVALTPETIKAFNLMNKNVRIKNTTNGKSIIAKVTDTGGFGNLGRVADLVPATRDYIGCSDLCQVEISF